MTLNSGKTQEGECFATLLVTGVFAPAAWTEKCFPAALSSSWFLQSRRRSSVFKSVSQGANLCGLEIVMKQVKMEENKGCN